MRTVNTPCTVEKRPLLLGAAAAAFLICAAGAGAAPAAEDVPQVVVRYADLNLANEQGLKTLYRRIAAAAQAVCPQSADRELSLRSLVQECREQAIARAIHDVNIPQLAALQRHRSKAS